MRILFVVLRSAGAVAILAAIVGQLITTSAFWDSRGITDHTILFVNFFSFFTIDSNVLAVVVLAVGAVVLLRGGVEPRLFGTVRAAVTAYMAVTGIVYNLLLRGVNVSEGLVLPWSNEVLHVVGPLLVVGDWLFAPGRAPLDWRRIRVILAFPIVWAAYTLLRGPFAPDPLAGATTWYPYPFLNPALAPTGYASVALYVLLIAAIIGLAGAGVIWVSRRPARPVVPSTP
ncbi:MAG: Pr6Pr family membrane protein [Micrococcales bacterium]|nr:Pr6Pr family membrane protein [Micrococcales bacterium]